MRERSTYAGGRSSPELFCPFALCGTLFRVMATGWAQAMDERARLMSNGLRLSVKLKVITSGPQANTWGVEIGDPRRDSDRPALSTARMTVDGMYLRWLPWQGSSADQPLTVAFAQFYFPT